MKLSLAEVFNSLARAVGAPRVLCADDDGDVRALCTTALTRAGFVTDIATNGSEVLQKLEHSEYSAILLDLGMPSVHGATILSVLQRHRPELLRRIIVVTGLPEAAVDVVRAQVAAVLRKPVALDDLVAEVNRCATKHPRRRPVEGDATVRV